MRPPSYFERMAGVRSTLPYLAPPRTWAPRASVEVVAEEAEAPPMPETPAARAVPAPPAAWEAAGVEQAFRPAPVDTPEDVLHTGSAVGGLKPAAPREVQVVLDEPVKAVQEPPVAEEAEVPLTPRVAAVHEPARKAVVREEAREERAAVKPATVAPNPRVDESRVPEVHPPAKAKRAVTRARAPRSAVPREEIATSAADHAPRFEKAPAEPAVASVAAPLSPPRRLVQSPRERKPESELRIGSIDVKVVPPPAEPPQQVVVAAPPAPEGPLSRGFASSIGLRQG
jgi:hypothetical protein